jgi:hypothetical protein
VLQDVTSPGEEAPRSLRSNVVRVDEEPWALLSRYSSLAKLLRVTALCVRFFRRCRWRDATDLSRAAEIRDAKLRLIRCEQRRCYSDELSSLRKPGSVPRRSSLLRLYPVLDPARTMLVGGRLSYSHVPFSERHPPILPKTSPLAELFIRNAHAAMLHASATLTTSYLMRQVWIPGAQSMVKRFIRSCVPCFRFRPRHGGQLMGQLPPTRVTPARPFSRTGLDYAGPIMCRTTAGRGHKSYKAYIALFVCMATKAVHLEVVSDLTTNAFLLAFRRFVSRRGLCAELYSDNGTTFVGADAELRRLFQSASDLYKEVAPTLAQDGITWSFIPPYSPHFGGLWEAGVKSVKSLLLKAIGPRTLTFEEMTTYLAQVEACLNSRPLTPLSSDASDVTALTPAHFLVGSTLGLVPEPPIEEDPSKLLVRWRQVQQAQQCFWRRWSLQYLNHLQQRSRWRGATVNFAVGQLVLVHDHRNPPAKWILGRVTATHPGADGLVRVVTVRTANSECRRPITKLSPLPMEPAPDGGQQPPPAP